MRFRKRKADPQPPPAENLRETLTEGNLIVNGISDEQLERIVKDFSAFVFKSDKAFDRFILQYRLPLLYLSGNQH